MSNLITLIVCLATIGIYSFCLVKAVDDYQAYKFFKKRGYDVSVTKVQVATIVFTVLFFFLIAFWIINGFIGVLT